MLTNEVIHEISEQVYLSQEAASITQLLLKELESHPNAVGIAAPQIGILKQLILCKINGKWIPMINPTWKPRYSELKESKEGCLSFPGEVRKMKRQYRIEVEYLDILMQPQSMKLTGLASYIVQHECDHLEGKTIC